LGRCVFNKCAHHYPRTHFNGLDRTKTKVESKQPLNLLQALILVSAILMIIYAAKTATHELNYFIILLFVIGLGALILFVKQQLKSASPMIDFSLFKHPVISTSMGWQLWR
jgi:DHA2 family multidrug resistance protein-like MFS transporter